MLRICNLLRAGNFKFYKSTNTHSSMKLCSTYLSSFELRRLPIENVAGLDALGKHPYRPIEHALDMTCHLKQHMRSNAINTCKDRAI